MKHAIPTKGHTDPERAFLAACDLAIDNLRTPMARYRKVSASPTTLAHADAFMKKNRSRVEQLVMEPARKAIEEASK